jgi:myosin regulatory light chain 12
MSYPGYLSPNVTPTKSGKAQKSRARREPSGVFSLFQPQQIQQFKEAFSLIDQDRDGLVGEQDLKDTFTSLGACSTTGTLERGVLTPPHPRNCAVPRDDGRAAHITPGGR